MEEYVFYVFITIVLLVAHQLIVVAAIGRTGWSMAIELAPSHLDKGTAVCLLVVWQIAAVAINALIWYIIPMSVMIPIMLVSEAVGLWQLRKIASKA